MEVTDTLGPALLVLMARCKTIGRSLHRQEAVAASTAVLPHTFASRLLVQRLCDSMHACEYRRENSRVYVQQEISYLLQQTVGIISPGKARLIVY